MISDNLSNADLFVDEIYGGSRQGNAKDDPLPALLGVDSGAGFRHLGKRPGIDTLRLLVLKSTLRDQNWPDRLDRETGVLTYYGDNRAPGDLHDTPRQGNLILRNLFDIAHSRTRPQNFPPILVFASTGYYRDVQFLGLAIPGATGMNADEDLVAVWRATNDGVRFQNYKASFTVLDVGVVARAWITDAREGNAILSQHAPAAWLEWVQGRKISALRAQPATLTRTKHQQLPTTSEGRKYVDAVYESFKDNPIGFEKCALELARLVMPNIHSAELTRPWRDGGRDAMGTYRIAAIAGHVDVAFALEAKCYSPKHGVGVDQLSRLISRLRYRQFGILVTTSYLSLGAYKEIVDDAHPVVVISANDIATIAIQKFGNVPAFRAWMRSL